MKNWKNRNNITVYIERIFDDDVRVSPHRRSIKIEPLSAHTDRMVYTSCVYRDCAAEKVISLSMYVYIRVYT